MRTIRLLPLLALVACAHAQTPAVQPIVITGNILDGAHITFMATAKGMKSLSDSRVLTRDQVLAWNDFFERWRVGYRKAVDAWKKAKKNLDEPAVTQATALLSNLLSELATWQFVVAGSGGPS